MLLPHKQTMISHQPFQTVTITTIKYEYKTNINRSIQGITNLHCSTSKGSSHRPNIHLLIVLIFVIFLFRHTATLLFLQPICFSYQTKTNVTHSITYKTPYRHHHSSVQKQHILFYFYLLPCKTKEEIRLFYIQTFYCVTYSYCMQHL